MEALLLRHFHILRRNNAFTRPRNVLRVTRCSFPREWWGKISYYVLKADASDYYKHFSHASCLRSLGEKFFSIWRELITQRQAHVGIAQTDFSRLRMRARKGGGEVRKKVWPNSTGFGFHVECSNGNLATFLKGRSDVNSTIMTRYGDSAM